MFDINSKLFFLNILEKITAKYTFLIIYPNSTRLLIFEISCLVLEVKKKVHAVHCKRGLSLFIK